MRNVLSLQMLPAAGLCLECVSNISCQSSTSCESTASCVSDVSKPKAELLE